MTQRPKPRTIGTGIGFLTVAAMITLIGFLVAWYNGDLESSSLEQDTPRVSAMTTGQPTAAVPADDPPSRSEDVRPIHSGHGRDWRLASDQKKLATCEHFLVILINGNALRPNIESMAREKRTRAQLADRLRTCLDAALGDELTDAQPLSDMAALCMLQMGWFIE